MRIIFSTRLSTLLHYFVLLIIVNIIHEIKADFEPQPTKDLVFVYDKIDPVVSFEGFVNKIRYIKDVLIRQHPKTFRKFFITFSNQTDVIVQEITYEHDDFSNFNFNMDQIKKEKRTESPMKTLLKALQVCSSNSLIFVFTIAHPEDSSLLPNILNFIEIKKIEVGFALEWNHFSEGIPEEYRNISFVSNGIIYDNIFQVFDFMPRLLHTYAHKVNLLTVNNNKNSRYNVSMDEFLNEITVSSANKYYINLADSNNTSSYYMTKALRTARHLKGRESDIQIIETLLVDSLFIDIKTKGDNENGFYSLRVFGFSYFNFNYGFSTNRINSIEEASPRPVLDIPNYVYVSSTNPKYNLDFQYCEIIISNGYIEDKISLRKMNGSSLYFGLFEPTLKSHFYLRVTFPINGKPIQRMSATSISSTVRVYEAKNKLPFCTTFEECVIRYSLFSGLVLVIFLLKIIFSRLKLRF